jgi:hypothetical protein
MQELVFSVASPVFYANRLPLEPSKVTKVIHKEQLVNVSPRCSLAALISQFTLHAKHRLCSLTSDGKVPETFRQESDKGVTL